MELNVYLSKKGLIHFIISKLCGKVGGGICFSMMSGSKVRKIIDCCLLDTFRVIKRSCTEFVQRMHGGSI